MAITFNSVLALIFLLTQWRITSLAWRRARTPLLRVAIALFDLVVFVGYLLSFSDLVARLQIPGRVAGILGAGALLYLVLSTGVVILHALIATGRKRLSPALDPTRRRLLHVAGNVALAGPFAVFGYGFVRRNDFHVREIDVPIPNLPRDLEGLRILQISDIHLSDFLSESDLERVIDAALTLHPNLAVITGDLISSRGDPLDACLRQLARLRADAGVFGCMGNHERYAAVENYTERAAARAGIRFLRGQATALRFGTATLNLAGVDHQSKAGGKRYLVGAEKLVRPDAVNVLLSHNPDVFPVAARQGYNLLLAGHTHGGQVTVEILDQAINPARFFTPYVYGLYRAGGRAAYVTRGIGTIGIPARIGAPPEISVVRLGKA